MPSDEASRSSLPQPPRESIRRKLHRINRRAALSRAALVGALAGLLVVGYELCVTGMSRLAQYAHTFSQGNPVVAWTVVPLVCAGLAAFAAWLVREVEPSASGSGIPQVSAYLVGLAPIRPLKVLFVKIIGGVAALGAGLSVGREGPSLQMAAAVGAGLGQVWKLNQRSIRPLVAACAGAGLGAAFNAPLAGFLFVMEELKREMSPLTYGTAFVASVAAVAVKRLLLGQGSSFRLEEVPALSLKMLPAAAIVGILGGLLGVLFNRGLMSGLELRKRRNINPVGIAAMAGLIGGGLYLVYPSLTQSGHSLAESILTGEALNAPLAGLILLGLCLTKVLLTWISYSSGVPGGVFAPMLVAGACLGASTAVGLNAGFPALGADPKVFATIGMAAILTGAVRTPLTGVVLIVEMTGQYQLLYALLVGTLFAYGTAELAKTKPLYELLFEHSYGHGSTAATPETHILDVFVEPDSRLDGRTLSMAAIPRGCLVIGIRRGEALIVPQGKTRVLAGDHLEIIVPAGEASHTNDVLELGRAP